MGNITVDIVLLLILIVANSVFAMAEAAVVAARQARLQQRAETGDRSAQVATQLSSLYLSSRQQSLLRSY